VNDVKKWYLKYPLDPVWCPSGTITSNRHLHQFKVFLLQTIPAFLYDVIRAIVTSDKSFQMTKHNQRLIEGMRVMEFFFLRTWRWQETNSLQLLASLDSKDQEIFNFSCKSFTWNDQFRSYVRGTRMFIMKESMEDYPLARRSLYRLQTLHKCLNLIYILIFLLVIQKRGSLSLTSFFRNLLNLIFNIFKKIPFFLHI